MADSRIWGTIGFPTSSYHIFHFNLDDTLESPNNPTLFASRWFVTSQCMALIDRLNLVKYQIPPFLMTKPPFETTFCWLSWNHIFCKCLLVVSFSVANPQQQCVIQIPNFVCASPSRLYLSTKCNFFTLHLLIVSVPFCPWHIILWVFTPGPHLTSHPSHTKASLPLRYSPNRQEGTAGRSTERSVAKSLGTLGAEADRVAKFERFLLAYFRNIPNSFDNFYL